MPFYFIAVGQKMPHWVETAYTDYAKRMPYEFRFILKEIRPEPRNHGKSVTQIKALEATRIYAALPASCQFFVLDEHGQDITTIDLAQLIKQQYNHSQSIAFIIGGADGLDQNIKNHGKLLRLSSMTLPHGLARVLLAEQLYRAWSILHHHPYHRA